MSFSRCRKTCPTSQAACGDIFSNTGGGFSGSQTYKLWQHVGILPYVGPVRLQHTLNVYLNYAKQPTPKRVHSGGLLAGLELRFTSTAERLLELRISTQQTRLTQLQRL